MTTWFIPENDEIKAQLAKIEGPLKKSLEVLEGWVGHPPPIVIGMGSSEIYPAFFDENAKLNLHPAFFGPSIADEEARLMAGMAEMPRAMSLHERLYLTLLEAFIRFALTVRSGIAPAKWAHLEASQSSLFLGAGVWLAREAAEYLGEEPLFLGAITDDAHQSLFKWGRGTHLFWSHLAARVGKSQTIAYIEAALGHSSPEMGEAVVDELAHELTDFGDFWQGIGEKLVAALPPNGHRAEFLAAGDEKGLSGYADAYSFLRLRLEVGGPGNPAQFEGLSAFLSLKTSQGWQRAQGPLHEGGLLLVGFGTAGPWKAHREPSPFLGRWWVRSVGYGAQRFAIHGMAFELTADGYLELDMVEAVMAPKAQTNMGLALEVGFSGRGDGRWSYQGNSLHLDQLKTEKIKMHTKDLPVQFNIPAGGIQGSADFIARTLESAPWTVDLEGERLNLLSQIGGMNAWITLDRVEEHDPDRFLESA